MSNNLDQLTDWLKEHKITEVECLISDLTGITRGKISPTNKFIAEKGMRLPESVLLQTVTGDYVDDDIYYELLDPADIDMICRPDENAVFLVPWAIEPTAQVIHDTYDKQGNPIELSPRNVLESPQALRRQGLAADRGAGDGVLPDQAQRRPGLPAAAAGGRSGRPETGAVVLHRSGQRIRPAVRRRLRLVRTAGAGPRHADPRRRHRADGNQLPSRRCLHLADQILVFKRTMREARSSTTWPPPSWPSR
jgi:glutamine synthetase